MEKIYLYNTLSRRKEEFKSIKNKFVGLYTCGPTVYNFAHLGNLRTYLFEDLLKRTLVYNGYQVKHVMNITDVGHLTGDMNMGEDKIESGAKREGKTAWEIADFYTQAFKQDLNKLNIGFPDIWCLASQHIKEQIALIKNLEKKNYTYITKDGVYFNTALISNYNKLSHLPLKQLKEGARVEKNPEKKNPTDFALWKFSKPVGKRQMEWDSPWGVGFPGWHLECSAMSLKYLSDNLDIHCGGIDHINIHHTNEIAQSEAATEKKFFNYWLHGAFLNISGGKKMAKSGNNFLTLKSALEDKGIDPLAYRLAACQVHYRKMMEYSFKSLQQAQNSLRNLKLAVAALGEESGTINLNFQTKFRQVVNNDLNIPQALALISQVLKARMEDKDKRATILDFDRILGLDLDKAEKKREVIKPWGEEIRTLGLEIDKEMKALLSAREKARADKDWTRADKIRAEIVSRGFILEDVPEGQKLVVKNDEK
ncbi:MAG: cysteinyl-tRNA synthetase [Patescibacteria group bacterium]|nr:cysteinyl-tRNA synthetase [Patescibacteria group bacterium]